MEKYAWLIILTLAQTISFLVSARNSRRERRLTEERGLLENPERCADHEARLRSVERSIMDMTGQLSVLGWIHIKLDNISEDIGALKNK